MLRCAVLRYAVLRYAVLRCAVLRCAALCCAVQRCAQQRKKSREAGSAFLALSARIIQYRYKHALRLRHAHLSPRTPKVCDKRRRRDRDRDAVRGEPGTLSLERLALSKQ